MANANFKASLALLLAHEGGFTNNPRDPGGPTNFGVTQRVYDVYRISKHLPTQSVKLIAPDEVLNIYKAEYWDTTHGDDLPAGVDYALFDYAVNSGVTRAVEDLQRTLNANANFYGISGQLKIDGRLALATCQALGKAGQNGSEQLIIDYCKRRLNFMKSLKQWSTFGKGWERRVEGKDDGEQANDDGVVDLACKMALAPIAVVAPQPALELVDSLPAAPAAPPAPWPGATPPPAPPEPSPAPEPADAAQVLPPATIGAYAGELRGKAFPSQVAMIRTVQGAGAALAAAGVTGQTALDAAGTVKDHVNGTVIGQLSLVAFVLCMITGVGLVLYKFFEQRNEKKST